MPWMKHRLKSVSPKFCCLCIKELEEAQKAVAERNELRQNIEELEEENEELRVHVFCIYFMVTC